MAEAQEARASHREGGVAGESSHIRSFYCGSILNAVLVHSSLTCSPLEPGTESVEEGECCQAGRGEKVSNETICEFVLAVATSFSSIVNLIFNSVHTRQEMLAQGLDPNPPTRQDHEKIPFPKYEEYEVGFNYEASGHQLLCS